MTATRSRLLLRLLFSLGCPQRRLFFLRRGRCVESEIARIVVVVVAPTAERRRIMVATCSLRHLPCRGLKPRHGRWRREHVATIILLLSAVGATTTTTIRAPVVNIRIGYDEFFLALFSAAGTGSSLCGNYYCRRFGPPLT
jgi:hypothetical protein